MVKRLGTRDKMVAILLHLPNRITKLLYSARLNGPAIRPIIEIMKANNIIKEIPDPYIRTGRYFVRTELGDKAVELIHEIEGMLPLWEKK